MSELPEEQADYGDGDVKKPAIPPETDAPGEKDERRYDPFGETMSSPDSAPTDQDGPETRDAVASSAAEAVMEAEGSSEVNAASRGEGEGSVAAGSPVLTARRALASFPEWVRIPHDEMGPISRVDPRSGERVAPTLGPGRADAAGLGRYRLRHLRAQPGRRRRFRLGPRRARRLLAARCALPLLALPAHLRARTRAHRRGQLAPLHGRGRVDHAPRARVGGRAGLLGGGLDPGDLAAPDPAGHGVGERAALHRGDAGGVLRSREGEDLVAAGRGRGRTSRGGELSAPHCAAAARRAGPWSPCGAGPAGLRC